LLPPPACVVPDDGAPEPPLFSVPNKRLNMTIDGCAEVREMKTNEPFPLKVVPPRSQARRKDALKTLGFNSRTRTRPPNTLPTTRRAVE
jgi:hypothetical protein